MAVSNTQNKNSYISSGGQTNFAYAFKVYNDSDLTVYVNGILRTLTTDYTVTDAGVDTGGNILFTSGLVDGDAVVITRVLGLTQGTDYVENDPFPAETHEDALDRLTFISQQIQEELDRSIKFDPTITDAAGVSINQDTASRAGNVLSFDDSGNLVASIELGSYKGTSPTITATDYDARSLVKDTSTKNVYFATQYSTAGTLLTEAGTWALVVDAATATTQATTATTQATISTTKAAEAAASAVAAAASKVAAAASETAADASETAADSSETAALASKNSAATYNSDAHDWASAAPSTAITDTDGNSGYSARHYANAAESAAAVVDGKVIKDGDSDTYVKVEVNADEDKVRVGAAGKDRMIVDSTGISVMATDGTTVAYKLPNVGTSSAGQVLTSDNAGGVSFKDVAHDSLEDHILLGLDIV
jgi:hypothetical protein